MQKSNGPRAALPITLALAALAAAVPSRSQIGADGQFLSGKVVDAKGYPLRNVFVAADGAFDTTDADGVFGPGKQPIAGLAREGNLQVTQARLAGSLLRMRVPAGQVVASLYRASGERLSSSSFRRSAAEEAAVDLDRLADGAGAGLYVLELETGAGPLRCLLTRTGPGRWTLGAQTRAPARTGLRKAAALPASVRISKAGYQPQQLSVPPGGNLGTVALAADWTAPVVDAPFDVASYFAPSGWAGDYKNIAVVADNRDNLRVGDPDQKNLKWTYTPTPADSMGWAAVVWQYPENNWGVKPGRKVTGATKITFWAKGALGGEALDFKAGDPLYVVPPDPGMYRDSFAAVNSLLLTADWKRYEVDFDPGADLSSVLSGFVWASARPDNGQPVTFYLDEIRFE